MIKNFFNMVELAKYRVIRDVEYTTLRAGDEHTAYLVKSFGVEYVQMGFSMMDPKYFDLHLAYGGIERVDLPPWQRGWVEKVQEVLPDFDMERVLVEA